MAISQASNVKELLQRSNIRTMKKDLKKLREADSAKESQKIIGFKGIGEEAEKQKQFVLRSKEAEAKEQLEVLAKQKAPVMLKKNEAISNSQQLQAKINPIDQKEKMATLKQFDSIEKQRLPLDQQKAALQEKIENLGQQEQELNKKEQEVKATINTIDSKLQEAKPVPSPTIKAEPVK